jgi:hypothetical protein
MGRVTATVMLVGLALAAAFGCGGNGSNDEDEINEVLTTSFTTADPAQCQQLTQKGLQQLAPSIAEAEDPAQACREALDPNASADSIEISEVSVDGDHGTAKVTPQGGTFGGSVVTVALADQDGWKIDGFSDVEIVDREAFLASLDKATEESFGNDALRPPDARCIADYIRQNATDAELEQSVTTREAGFVYDAVRMCLGGGIDLIAITQLINNQLRSEGIDPRQARCLAGLSIAGQKSATVEEFATDPTVEQRIAKALKKGAFICARA